jgi:oleate hydratase
MPHFFKSGQQVQTAKRNPEDTQAYLIGGGIGSLTAAVHLIQDAKVPPKNIHILESLPIPGGSMDGAGDPKDGYVLRGGRMFNFSYINTYDLMDRVPSLMDPSKTLLQETKDFNAVPENKTLSKARLLATGKEEVEILDVSKMGLTSTERLDLIKISLESEKSLGKKRIDECFSEAFFKTKFWYMWATMFAFQPWHSAVEFRRYLHRFLHEFPRISTLAGVERTVYNQYDSMIQPICKYLEAQGVDFRYNTKVLDIDFITGIPITVDELHMVTDGTPMTAQLDPADIVIVTLGSITSNATIGDNTHPAAPVVEEELQDCSWKLWAKLAAKNDAFGKPSVFSTRIGESTWESFTVTLNNEEFLARITGLTHNEPGTGALMTFKDSNWLMSIVIPHQPHFPDQPLGTFVLWGYGLHPDSVGNFVAKKMADCTGQEILSELLQHLHFPQHPILEQAIVRPCLMPYITAQFLTREAGDRPHVIPKGSTNLALVGQFVEIEEDTVFTVEYSVRGAQMAVCELMGLGEECKPKEVFKGEKHLGALSDALHKMMT